MDRISTKEERRAWRRHYEAKKDLDDVMKCYRRVHGYLERLNVGHVRPALRDCPIDQGKD